jgi:ribosome biogenesis GTPase A
VHDCLQVGIQGDLWVVGAQNAGKSSLINALKRESGTLEATAPLTTAPLPGTTLGMTPVSGLPLLRRSRCYDTPGIPHPYQYTSRLGGACCRGHAHD